MGKARVLQGLRQGGVSLSGGLAGCEEGRTMRLGDLATIKHLIGVALLVPYWPSRRMIRRLQAENEELRQVAERTSEFCQVVDVTAAYLCDSADRFRTNS